MLQAPIQPEPFYSKAQVPNQGGLAATFDLAAFALHMIAPVKKSVNHSKTLTSMRDVQRSLARTTREYIYFFCSW